MSGDLHFDSFLLQTYAGAAARDDETDFIDPRIEEISRRAMSLALEDELFEYSDDGSLPGTPRSIRRAQSVPLTSPLFFASSPSKSPAQGIFESPRSLSVASTVKGSPRTFDGSPASIKSSASSKKTSSSSFGSSPRKPPLHSPGKSFAAAHGGGGGEGFADISPADLTEIGMSKSKPGLYVVRPKVGSRERIAIPALVIDAHQSKHSASWGPGGGKVRHQMSRATTEEIARIIESECDIFKSPRGQTETGSRIRLDAKDLERRYRKNLSPDAKATLRGCDNISIVATYVKDVDCWSIHFHLE